LPWYNGIESGELAQCAAVAGHYGVPPHWSPATKEYLVLDGSVPPRRVTEEGAIPTAFNLLDF
jgi:hypothetical protein